MKKIEKGSLDIDKLSKLREVISYAHKTKNQKVLDSALVYLRQHAPEGANEMFKRLHNPAERIEDIMMVGTGGLKYPESKKLMKLKEGYDWSENIKAKREALKGKKPYKFKTGIANKKNGFGKARKLAARAIGDDIGSSVGKRIAKSIGKKIAGAVPLIGGLASAAMSGDASAAIPILGDADELGKGSDLVPGARKRELARQVAKDPALQQDLGLHDREEFVSAPKEDELAKKEALSVLRNRYK